MACLKVWKPNEHKVHDDNVDAALVQSDPLIDHTKALTLNFEEIRGHVNACARAVLRGRNRTSKSNPRLHVMLENVQRLGKRIFAKPPSDMTKAQIATHHRNLAAVVPLLEQNAKHAAAIADSLTQLSKFIAAIVVLYEK